MVLFDLAQDFQGSATDTCDPSPQFRVVGVQSNQPALGGGSGSTPFDFVSGDAAFCVRAERDGTSIQDRIYTVTIEAKDHSGNATREPLTIRVPHDLGHGGHAKCGHVDPSRVVEDGDPRCTRSFPASAPPVAPAQAAPPSPETGGASGGCASASSPGSSPIFAALLLLALATRSKRHRGTR
jgi:MYXO-CTERM domain-containing protein